MEFEIIGEYKKAVWVRSKTMLITDVQSAMDLLMAARNEAKCLRIIVDKSAVTEDFFKMSTHLAGDILQKFIIYHATLAIVGDFSGYKKSYALKDFFNETTNGNNFFFAETIEEAIEKIL